MLDKSFAEMPLEKRLDAQISELLDISKLYSDLVHVKGNYNYRYRLDAVECQLDALIDIRNSDYKDINDWHLSFKEDLEECNRKNK